MMFLWTVIRARHDWRCVAGETIMVGDHLLPFHLPLPLPLPRPVRRLLSAFPGLLGGSLAMSLSLSLSPCLSVSVIRLRHPSPSPPPSPDVGRDMRSSYRSAAGCFPRPAGSTLRSGCTTSPATPQAAHVSIRVRPAVCAASLLTAGGRTCRSVGDVVLQQKRGWGRRERGRRCRWRWRWGVGGVGVKGCRGGSKQWRAAEMATEGREATLKRNWDRR